ncbi:MAG: excinuclease ABC subunit UvrC [Alphaproteobacteria bacterium]
MSFEILKPQIQIVPTNSGIYKFLDNNDRVLYVGKAKNLHKRLSSYMNKNSLSTRILRMVTLAKKIEFVITKTEVEALLLEHNLIKKLSPDYNILLKDDKTFPQILITNHQYPQISKYRGLKNNKGQYFGPFISAYDVNRTIDILRKNFQIRNCSDQEFKSRKKPCLEYQIKKCSAPCVQNISIDDYSNDVKNAIDVLTGKSREVQDKFQKLMEEFSAKMEYEKALIYRDKIKALNGIQTKQNINFDKAQDFDMINAVAINQRICFYVSFYRLGQNYGAKPYFFELEEEGSVGEVY